MKKFRKIAVGGTFDELHKGHKTLLLKAFDLGNLVLIGLCSDQFVKKLGKPHTTASYDERLQELQSFLSKMGVAERSEIVSLNDPFGPTITDKCIDAVLVSEETRKNGEKINAERMKKGLKSLQVISINMVPSEDYSPISTTRIHKGEIDREGRLTKKKRC